MRIKLNTSENFFFTFLKAIRIHQWVKNFLVFIPMLASHQITIQNINNSFLAFIAFCIIASSGYIINDLLDLKADRSHPYNKLRPFASGTLSTKHGLIIFFILCFFGFTLSFFININFLFLILSYWILSLLYSFILKKKIIIDIFTLGILYTLRIIGSSFATEIEMSLWLFAFSIFLFLSLAAVKRLSELINVKERNVFKIEGRSYNLDDLPIVRIFAIFFGSISIVVIAFYINSPNILDLYSKPLTLLGMFLTLSFWLIRIIFLSNNGKIKGDPIIYALKDNISRICFLVILSLFVINFI
jgi:4-hydroxybenzoate polyprenyltransferase